MFISGLAVTICFSTGKNLFCLNSTSPALQKKKWKLKEDTSLAYKCKQEGGHTH
jgi:hypothetical protein